MSETTDTTTEPADEAEVTADEGTQSTSTLAEDVQQADTPAEDAETFPREYVEKLRQENGKYRQRASEADSLANRLHTELVRATGRLADPTDLPFDVDHIADAGKMSAAIDALLETKPHLASRRPTGDIGQGNRGQGGGSFSLLQMLKDRT
ncbi:hypothetical protein ACJH6J_18330 [Mycobacterium sp. SMC-18]|uniref:hypothetical protein n=1 Tax=Mycobacterium sp. SMC-18 TaxID=3381629 RepID=UPI003876ADD8